MPHQVVLGGIAEDLPSVTSVVSLVELFRQNSLDGFVVLVAQLRLNHELPNQIESYKDSVDLTAACDQGVQGDQGAIRSGVERERGGMKLKFDFITNPVHRAKLESFDFDEEIAERFVRDIMNCTAPDGTFPPSHVNFPTTRTTTTELRTTPSYPSTGR
jgi:hypothetical protein